MTEPSVVQLYAGRIDQLLARPDSHAAGRLFDLWRTAGDRDAFVAALIGRLLQERHQIQGAPR